MVGQPRRAEHRSRQFRASEPLPRPQTDLLCAL